MLQQSLIVAISLWFAEGVVNYRDEKYVSACNDFSHIDNVNNITMEVRSRMYCIDACSKNWKCFGVNYCPNAYPELCELLLINDVNQKEICCKMTFSKPQCRFYQREKCSDCMIASMSELNIAGVCDKEFSAVYGTNSTGQIMFGTKNAIIERAENGENIRILIKSLPDRDTVIINTAMVFKRSGELMAHSVFNIERDDLTGNLQRLLFLVSTTGLVQMQEWQNGEHTLISNTFHTVETTWYANGRIRTFSTGYELMTAVKSGSDVFVKRWGSYFVPVYGIELNEPSGNLSVQFPWELSMFRRTYPLLHELMPNQYFLSSCFDTNPAQHFARWFVESGYFYYSTITNYQQIWYTGSYWISVYENNEVGDPIRGSIVRLMTFLNKGHRIKVKYGNKVDETSSVIVKEDVVYAVVNHNLEKTYSSSKIRFSLPLHRTIVIISTTGLVHTYTVPIGSNTVATSITSTETIEWFIDTAQYLNEYVLNSNKQTNVNMAEIHTKLVSSASDMRILLNTNEENIYFRPDFFTADGEDFVFTFMHHVGLVYSTSNGYTVPENVIASYYKVFSNCTVVTIDTMYNKKTIVNTTITNYMNMTWFL